MDEKERIIRLIDHLDKGGKMRRENGNDNTALKRGRRNGLDFK